MCSGKAQAIFLDYSKAFITAPQSKPLLKYHQHFCYVVTQCHVFWLGADVAWCDVLTLGWDGGKAYVKYTAFSIYSLPQLPIPEEHKKKNQRGTHLSELAQELETRKFSFCFLITWFTQTYFERTTSVREGHIILSSEGVFVLSIFLVSDARSLVANNGILSPFDPPTTRAAASKLITHCDSFNAKK